MKLLLGVGIIAISSNATMRVENAIIANAAITKRSSRTFYPDELSIHEQLKAIIMLGHYKTIITTLKHAEAKSSIRNESNTMLHRRPKNGGYVLKGVKGKMRV